MANEPNIPGTEPKPHATRMTWSGRKKRQKRGESPLRGRAGGSDAYTEEGSDSLGVFMCFSFIILRSAQVASIRSRVFQICFNFTTFTIHIVYFRCILIGTLLQPQRHVAPRGRQTCPTPQRAGRGRGLPAGQQADGSRRSPRPRTDAARADFLRPPHGKKEFVNPTKKHIGSVIKEKICSRNKYDSATKRPVNGTNS